MPIVDLDKIKFDDETVPAGGRIVDLSTIKFDEEPSPITPGEIFAGIEPGEPTYQSGSLGKYPPQFARGLIKQLPMAGMIGGGAAGAAIGGPLGPLAAPVGAGLGGGMGAALQGLIEGQQKPLMENWRNIAKEAAMGATAEMGGPVLAKGIQAITSPFAKTVQSRMAADASINAAQKLVEEGAAISPEVIAGTKTARFFDWMAEKMWPASAIMANKRQGLQEVASGLKEEFVTSRGLYDTSKGGVNSAWENWVQKAGGEAAPYEMSKTAEVLNQAMEKPFAQVGMFWKKHAATFRDAVNQGPVTVQDIRDLLNVLNPTAAKGVERTSRMKIADAIMEDLGASGNKEMVDALQRARELSRLQRIAGPLQSIFNKSMVEPTKAGEEVIFNPATFTNLWNQRRGHFLDNKNYSAEDIRVIDAFAAKMKALVPDLGMASKFNPPTSLTGVTQLNLENPLAVGGAVFKYPGLVVPVGMDMLLANSLMKPTGIMRKFLTTGFNPPVLSSKVGIMEGMEAANAD